MQGMRMQLHCVRRCFWQETDYELYYVVAEYIREGQDVELKWTELSPTGRCVISRGSKISRVRGRWYLKWKQKKKKSRPQAAAYAKVLLTLPMNSFCQFPIPIQSKPSR